MDTAHTGKINWLLIFVVNAISIHNYQHVDK